MVRKVWLHRGRIALGWLNQLHADTLRSVLRSHDHRRRQISLAMCITLRRHAPFGAGSMCCLQRDSFVYPCDVLAMECAYRLADLNCVSFGKQYALEASCFGG